MRIYKFFLVTTYKEQQDLACRFNFNMKYVYNNQTDLCLILYAWTTDKGMKDEFIRIHSDRFHLATSTVYDDAAFAKFNRDYIEEKLNYYPIREYDKKKNVYKTINMLLTRNEHTVVTEDAGIMYGTLIEPYVSSEYIYLKQEFIDALDVFLYTVYHDIYYAESESEEDLVEYNLSYDKTPGGRSYSKLVESIDQLTLFSRLFASLLR